MNAQSIEELVEAGKQAAAPVKLSGFILNRAWE